MQPKTHTTDAEERSNDESKDRRRVGRKRSERRRAKKRKNEDVQKEERKAIERIEKCGKRRTVDWTTRSRSSDDRKIGKNENPVEKSEMGSRKTRERGDKNPVYLDEHGETSSEMGTVV
jgi:hypothetical protein